MQETVVRYFTLLMRANNLHVYRFSPECMPEVDLGLHKALHIAPTDPGRVFAGMQDRVIYMAQTNFLWRYLALRLPECGQILLVGPYLCENISDQLIMTTMEALHLPPAHFPTVSRAYHSIPIVPSESILFTAVSSLGEMLWGRENYTTQFILQQEYDGIYSAASIPDAPAAVSLSMELIEQRYEGEAQMLYAIAHGQYHKASAILSAFHPQQVDQRTANPLRNTKNYAIIANTLMRKAVQQGGVHPYYIDQLSSTIARRIEQAMTVGEAQQLILTMAHKYCLLVKNHNLAEYSRPVQRVIVQIDTDVAGDLSLHAHAKRLGVNASYLSALFKKETGMTLTDYVNRKRIDFAIYLLNASGMQIQTIAQHCGMPDVNYFTRTFKRLMGMTPSQYRRQARSK